MDFQALFHYFYVPYFDKILVSVDVFPLFIIIIVFQLYAEVKFQLAWAMSLSQTVKT